MGAEQPKKVARVTKAQIDIGTLKARIHLELFRDRKNAEIIKGEKELVAKIRGKSRNKTEEVLIAERVVIGLKLAQGTCPSTQPATCSSDMHPHCEDRHTSSPRTC
jgi:hypothetical protein